jgi:hypothetical protein
MSISESSEYSDVLQTAYIAVSLNVTTTQVHLKVGATQLIGRETLIVYNRGSQAIYVGPSGVTTTTGIRLTSNQMLTLNVGEGISVFAVTNSGSADVTIQELA